MTGPAEEQRYPQRLYHAVPSWVDRGSFFHIRIRTAPANPRALTDPQIAHPMLASVQYYHTRQRWQCLVFLLMPDHVHALLTFPVETHLSRTIGDWKRYASTRLGVTWQANYFDHRIRNHDSLAEKHAYIMRNPVVKGLCAHEMEWPWVWQPEVPS